MKRLLVASILMVGVTAVCILSRFTVINITNETEKMLAKTNEAVLCGDSDMAIQSAERLYDYWLQKAGCISLFTNHRKVEELSVLFSRLKSRIGTSDYYQIAEEIKSRACELKNNERITIAGF